MIILNWASYESTDIDPFPVSEIIKEVLQKKMRKKKNFKSFILIIIILTVAFLVIMNIYDIVKSINK